MRFHRPGELEAVLAQHREIALDLLVHRVDDERIARGDIEQHVRIGAGERDRTAGWGSWLATLRCQVRRDRRFSCERRPEAQRPSTTPRCTPPVRASEHPIVHVGRLITQNVHQYSASPIAGAYASRQVRHLHRRRRRPPNIGAMTLGASGSCFADQVYHRPRRLARYRRSHPDDASCPRCSDPRRLGALPPRVRRSRTPHCAGADRGCLSRLYARRLHDGLEIFVPLAEQGNPDAEYSVGRHVLQRPRSAAVLCRSGEMVSPRRPTRVKPAPNTTSAFSTRRVKACRRTLAEAAKWFRKAADQGKAKRPIQPRLHVQRRPRRGAGLRRGGEVVSQGGRQGDMDSQNRLGALYARRRRRAAGLRRGGEVVSQGGRSRRHRGAERARLVVRQRPGRAAGLCRGVSMVRHRGIARCGRRFRDARQCRREPRHSSPAR